MDDTASTEQGTWITLEWTPNEPTYFEDYVPIQWHPDGTWHLRIARRPEGSESVRITLKDRQETPANRHERRQSASRKHQRAAQHGAGDQKRIAAERRSE